MDNPLEAFFDGIFVINLDERPEKWRDIQLEMQKLGISRFERISAFRPRFEDLPPEYYSAMKIVDYAASKQGYRGFNTEGIAHFYNVRQESHTNITLNARYLCEPLGCSFDVRYNGSGERRITSLPWCRGMVTRVS